MTALQHEVLSQTLRDLESFNTIDTYVDVAKCLDELEIKEPLKNNILQVYSKSIEKKKKFVDSSKVWVTALIKESK